MIRMGTPSKADFLELYRQSAALDCVTFVQLKHPSPQLKTGREKPSRKGRREALNPVPTNTANKSK
jgi:hypothetical protein